jgi:hypothetical protein
VDAGGPRAHDYLSENVKTGSRDERRRLIRRQYSSTRLKFFLGLGFFTA